MCRLPVSIPSSNFSVSSNRWRGGCRGYLTLADHPSPPSNNAFIEKATVVLQTGCICFSQPEGGVACPQMTNLGSSQDHRLGFCTLTIKQLGSLVTRDTEIPSRVGLSPSSLRCSFGVVPESPGVGALWCFLLPTIGPTSNWGYGRQLLCRPS